MRIVLFFILLLSVMVSAAQPLLQKQVSMEIRNQRLDQVLEIISNKGSFYFSYNSNIIRKDSLVSLQATNKTVAEVLLQLLPEGYEFRESGNYIIIRRKPVTVSINTRAESKDNVYHVSGYVLDDEAGTWIRHASIYEKNLMASTLTNENGYFTLRLRNTKKQVSLTVSKEFYRDTTFTVDPGFDQQLTITLLPAAAGLTIIGPDDYFAPEQLKLRVRNDTGFTDYTYQRMDSINVEGTRVGRFLISRAQQLQSLNLRRFFTARPFQASLIPMVGTHGKLAPQVLNYVSLNLIGGYNGGTKGLELGGVFNIDKKDVSYLQAAGAFNLVGGNMKGLQVSGINNTVLGKVKGMQLAGIYNHTNDTLDGLQIAGISNYANKKSTGLQASFIANVTRKEMHGAQIAGIINYAGKLRGLQLGLINIADSSAGLSIGLLNITFKGYHQLTLHATDIALLNAAIRTGTYRFYNILQGGMSEDPKQKLYTFGYGFGSRISLGRVFSVSPEITAHEIYLGHWGDANILGRGTLQFNIRLAKGLALSGGPAFNAYYSGTHAPVSGYRSTIIPASARTYQLRSNVKGWLGWSAGISFF